MADEAVERKPAEPLPPSAQFPSTPTPPPPAAPPPPRYPLFADEISADTVLPTRLTAPAPPSTSETAVRHEGLGLPLLGGEPLPEAPVDTPPTGRDRHWLPWLVGALALLLVASFGALLMLGGGDDDEAADGSTEASATIESAPAEASAPAGEPAATQKPAPQAKPGKPVELARSATVTVPAAAPPNQDVDGNRVGYDGENMLDGKTTTAWRMPGSAAGESVVLQLPQPTRLTEVGIVNGYAKGSGTFDWYEGNRRIRKVVWVFDGGEQITQELDDVRPMQMLDLKPVVTSSVTLRITRVSTPGDGRAARNYTAISEVSLLGSPAP